MKRLAEWIDAWGEPIVLLCFVVPIVVFVWRLGDFLAAVLK